MKKTIREQFHKAALEAYKEHGFKSYRHAEQQTGVNYSTIYMIVSRGRIPTRGQVIEWAEGLNESVNEWLVLAGYEPIPVELCLPSGIPSKVREEIMRLLKNAGDK